MEPVNLLQSSQLNSTNKYANLSEATDIDMQHHSAMNGNNDTVAEEFVFHNGNDEFSSSLKENDLENDSLLLHDEDHDLLLMASGYDTPNETGKISQAAPSNSIGHMNSFLYEDISDDEVTSIFEVRKDNKRESFTRSFVGLDLEDISEAEDELEFVGDTAGIDGAVYKCTPNQESTTNSPVIVVKNEPCDEDSDAQRYTKLMTSRPSLPPFEDVSSAEDDIEDMENEDINNSTGNTSDTQSYEDSGMEISEIKTECTYDSNDEIVEFKPAPSSSDDLTTDSKSPDSRQDDTMCNIVEDSDCEYKLPAIREEHVEIADTFVVEVTAMDSEMTTIPIDGGAAVIQEEKIEEQMLEVEEEANCEESEENIESIVEEMKESEIVENSEKNQGLLNEAIENEDVKNDQETVDEKIKEEDTSTDEKVKTDWEEGAAKDDTEKNQGLLDEAVENEDVKKDQEIVDEEIKEENTTTDEEMKTDKEEVAAKYDIFSVEEVKTEDSLKDEVLSTEDTDIDKQVNMEIVENEEVINDYVEMNQVVEKQEVINDYEKLNDEVLDEAESTINEDVTNEDGKKEETAKKDSDDLRQPLIGKIFKSDRKSARSTKPPWLMNENTENVDNEDEETHSDDLYDEDDKNSGDKSDDFAFIFKVEDDDEVEEKLEIDDDNDMREKLLQMLKNTKKTVPLVKTIIPNLLTDTHYEKRKVKPVVSNEFINSSSLGFKIISVAGGVDLETSSEPVSDTQPPADDDAQIKDKSIVDDNVVMMDCDDEGLHTMDDEDVNIPKEVIINEHLDMPTIKLTKTNDYKKIKGWNKKKLLTQDECTNETADAANVEEEEPQPSCSYATSEQPEEEPPKVLDTPKKSVSVFCSNNLDGFLEDKDLKISYNVPNLKSTNHDIDLLDGSVLVAAEETQVKTPILEQDDSNSSTIISTKDKDVYKPRTLAEKRKMLLDDGSVPKKRVKKERKKFSRRPFSSRFETPEKENKEITVQHFDAEENLLVPMEPDQSPVIMTDNLLVADDIRFLTRAESLPQDCAYTKMTYRSGPIMEGAKRSIVVPTRTSCARNRFIVSRLAEIKRKPTLELVPTLSKSCRSKRVPSILRTPSKSDFKPGPLCKKLELQISESNDWKTIITNLPEIKMHVTPEIGKIIHPAARRFVRFETFEISEERAEFALSMIAAKDKKARKSYPFPTQYVHNQQQIVMRKVIRQDCDWSNVSTSRHGKYVETELDIHQGVSKVVEDLLDYIDTKEIASKPIPFDRELDSTDDMTAPQAETKEGKEDLKARKRNNNVYRALKSLNVRIVDMPKTDAKMDHECNKEYCKDGCICESLLGSYPPSNHCGEAKCIFKCRCGFAKLSKAEAKGQEISERTLSRFDKEAKRNITAREERDFMQTAVRSGNNTIILAKNRESKRQPKFNFKRYQGYHVNFRDEEALQQQIIENDPKLRDCCQVELIRSDFSGIIPYCLAHNLYECHCGGKAAYDPREQRLLAQKFTDSVRAKYNTSPEKKLEPPDLEPEIEIDVETITKPTAIVNALPAKTFENMVAQTLALSARLRGTGAYYRARNRTNKYKNTMARKLKFDKTVDADIVNKWILLPSDVRVAHNIGEKHAYPEFADAADNEPHRGRLRTKLSQEEFDELFKDECQFSTQSSSELPPVLQKEYKNRSLIIQPVAAKRSVASVAPTKPIVNPRPLHVVVTSLMASNAMYVPRDSISRQFSQMIGHNRTTLKDFRLLLWPSLTYLYEKRYIQIWFSSHQGKLRFIVTDPMTTPKAFFTNIRTFESHDSPYENIRIDFIRWVLTKKGPDRKDPKNILVILKLQANLWEICGICEKNLEGNHSVGQNGTESRGSSDALVTISDSDEDDTKENVKVIKREKAVEEETDPLEIPNEFNSADTDECSPIEISPSHDSVSSNGMGKIKFADESTYKTVKQVVFANGAFSMKHLILQNLDDEEKGDVCVSAALPQVGPACKWRVLKVNSNFAILSFLRNGFNIKCSDILTIMKVSVRYAKTIFINTPEIKRNYLHKAFGIYVTPIFQDRIFIGPYLHQEEHGLETLRFLKNNLIGTEVFNVMHGITNVATTGLWYVQNLLETPTSDKPVIDLTEEEKLASIKSSLPKHHMMPPPSITRSLLKTSAISPEKIVHNKVPSLPVKINDDTFIVKKPDPTKPVVVRTAIATKSTGGGPRPSLPKLIKLVSTPHIPGQRVHVNNLETTATTKMNPVKQLKPRSVSTANDHAINVKIIKLQSSIDIASDMKMLESMLHQAKTATPKELEVLFMKRIRMLMRHNGLPLPMGGIPICFRLNFGNGVIMGYSYEKRIYVYWPGNLTRRFDFYDMETTISWLESELHEVFICIPTTFTIKVTPVASQQFFEYHNRGIISQKYFNEICVIGEFGIMRLAEAKQFLLCNPDIAKQKLAWAKGKSDKFKRAVLQIITSNNMTRAEFEEKIKSLREKTRATANTIIPGDYRAGPKLAPTSKQARKASLALNKNGDPIICIDSDDDKEAVLPRKRKLIDFDKTIHGGKKRRRTAQLLVDQRKSLLTRVGGVGALKVGPTAPSPRADKNVMEIDLTHMTTERVQSLLSKNIHGGSITLTKSQVAALQELSKMAKDCSGT